MNKKLFCLITALTLLSTKQNFCNIKDIFCEATQKLDTIGQNIELLTQPLRETPNSLSNQKINAIIINLENTLVLAQNTINNFETALNIGSILDNSDNVTYDLLERLKERLRGFRQRINFYKSKCSQKIIEINQIFHGNFSGKGGGSSSSSSSSSQSSSFTPSVFRSLFTN
jgi:hypothetical protein